MFYRLYFFVLNLIIVQSELNLYYTDLVSKTENVLQYNCLRIVTNTRERSTRINRGHFNIREIEIINHEIILFCKNEFSSKLIIEEKQNFISKLTFEELAKEKINIEQLYKWLAPIDLIENYQIYLNGLDSSLSKEIFYNCTILKFGPQCQFDYHYSNLSTFIDNYYRINEYDPSNLTCYQHLTCSRGPFPSCLDWSEICDGKIDCLNDEIDEIDCWKLEMIECSSNEYQCSNGQCIPKLFYLDNKNIFDCLDGSDEKLHASNLPNECHKTKPTFGCEDRICREKPLSSSCVNKREDILLKSMFSIKDNSISEECSLAIRCLFNRLHSDESSCQQFNLNMNKYFDTCPQIISILNYPIVFGDIYIAIDKSYLKQTMNYSVYICYNSNSRYDVPLNMISEIRFNNQTCLKDNYFKTFNLDTMNAIMRRFYDFIKIVYGGLKQYRLYLNYTSIICNQSSKYQCLNSSKCIPINNLFNGYFDCPYSDDENMSSIINNINLIKELNQTHFYCHSMNKYLSHNMINDGHCECSAVQGGRCVDENLGTIDSTKDILFSIICDEFEELSPIIIGNEKHTDETECEQWECDNLYTHCDGTWNCRNGKDEIGCDELSKSKCSLNQHLCVSSLTFQLICLDINQIYDGNIDCIGGTDEPIRILHTTGASLSSGLLMYGYKFYCINQGIIPMLPFMLCNGYIDCNYGDDEKFCETDQSQFPYRGICLPDKIKIASDAEKFLCAFLDMKSKHEIKYLKIDNTMKKTINENLLSSIPIKIFSQKKSLCHRGLDLGTCFCPSSYYGSKCEYQNERISLTIQFRSLSDSWQTQFVIIILLIDDTDQRIIHSYEQINYFLLQNCRTKYHFYLLYSTRPKDSTKTYSIHIDFYEKKSLIHRGSLLLPILYPFLPVYRHSMIIDIPRINNTKHQHCSNEKCLHGKCIKYFNNSNNLTFCQCEEGWSGKYCQIQHKKCRCSFDSLCIGYSEINQRSICVCPLNKFGSRCFLSIQINNKTICENGGEYIFDQDQFISNENFRCICQEGFSGDRCEIIDTKLSLSFNKEIQLSKEILIHFIEIVENDTHIRSTTFQTILFSEDSINITWSQPFHIVFIDISNKTYYLILVQNIYVQSRSLSKHVNPSDRCLHVNELFNERLDLIRRIKSYHLLCQNHSCFYDEIHFCFCYKFGEKRLSNCFKFDHEMKFDCSGQNECENGGQCFQDNPECPTKSICLCPSCYFGKRCQLTTNGFGLSLDVILGYQILPNQNLHDQSFIIKLSFALTIIFISIGFVNGILSLITFRNKNICEIGCGLYLFYSSITTLLITIIFGLKYFIVIYSHMSIITNQAFLLIQCYLFDFILRIFLSLDQWLNACVAIERTITVIKGTGFNKKKSKNTAKLVSIILLIIISISYIHDPIHRRIQDETNNDDTRIWCIVNYSYGLNIYNSFIQTFHFLGPFIINFLSVLILILKKTRQQVNVQKKQSYKYILSKTIKEHRQLLTGPIILTILGLPRLILLFVSKCMKSSNDVWLFLCGYFISFIPSMLTFIIFVLPSTFYKDTFRSIIKRNTILILRWFGFID